MENPKPMDVGSASQWDGSSSMMMMAVVSGRMMGCEENQKRRSAWMAMRFLFLFILHQVVGSIVAPFFFRQDADKFDRQLALIW